MNSYQTMLLPGQLFVYFANAALLTIPVSLVLLVWFQRTVRQEMLARDTAAGPGIPLSISVSVTAKPPIQGQAAAPLRVRLAVVYFFGALAAGAVGALLLFREGSVEFAWLRAFMVAYVLCWPLAVTLPILLAMSRRDAVLVAFVYCLIGGIAIFIWSVFSLLVLGNQEASPLKNVGWYGYFLALTAGPSFIFILITGGPKIRPVAPIVFAGLLTFSFATLVTFTIFTGLLDFSPATRDLLVAVPHSVLVWFMLTAVPVGFACWLLLRRLAWIYESKRSSDMQLLVDIWWFIAFFDFMIAQVAALGWWGMMGIAGFAAYRSAVAIGLAFWPVDRTIERPRELLLLRVFGYQRRTEKLFDAIAQPWRFEGSVTMIAGADLAGRIIDPGDIVAFAGGRLRDQFVRNTADLQRRLHEFDGARDPDGRFRVIKFFCHADVWQPAAESLMKRSSVILMDLRGFSEKNSGCEFELRKLAGHRRLDHTLFVVDEETDVDLLRSTLLQACKDAGFEAAPSIHLSQLDKQSARNLRQVSTELRTLAPVG
jgi:hypothetical protein